MSREAAIQLLEENKRWPPGTIRKEYIEEAEETIAWYNEFEHGQQSASEPEKSRKT